MKCRECMEFLMGYVEGSLPETQRAAFEEHLERCPPCIDYVHMYKETIRVSGKCRGDADVPEALVKAILSAKKAGKPEQGGRHDGGCCSC